ncbi:alpha/beta fold hydrolase [Ilumatobacter sp.]|uniref:alpha/beta fold hydrolase n=1 Tax=Ilumatobacter sp. TaxID=1967498 RepID=UPI003750B76B
MNVSTGGDPIALVMAGAAGVVFDKDGTLFDLDARWYPFFSGIIDDVAERLGDESLPVVLTKLLGVTEGGLVIDGLAAVGSVSEIGTRIIEELVSLGHDSDLARATVGEAAADARFGPVAPIGDIAGTLRALADRGFRLGIATSDGVVNTRDELVAHDLVDVFDPVRCADDGGPVKPDPAVLLQIAAEWNVAPADIVFVGDSRQDLATAQSAGTRFVARCDPTATPTWAAAAADAVVGDIAELVRNSPSPMSGPWAMNGGTRLWWQRTPGPIGGTRLLLINGLGSPSVAYQQGFVDRFVEVGFDVVRFDNRDVGRSSRSVDEYDASDMAADAIAVLDSVGWDDAVVFGQSMGGMIAQQLAIEYPERVTHLVSLMSSTGNGRVGGSDPAIREALLAVAPDDRAGWLDHRVETERFWASPDLWDPAWVRAKGAEMFDHGVDPAGTQRQYAAVLRSPVRDDMLQTVQVPALVMHGAADTLIDPSAGRHTADCLANARYVEIDGLGHDLPPGMWARLVDEVAAFVTTPSP